MAWSKDNSRVAKAAADKAFLEANRAELASDYIEEKQPLIDTFTDEQTNLQTQLNDLVLQSGTDIAEVVQARGGEVTLHERLNKTAALLAEKANQDYVDGIAWSVENAHIEAGNHTHFNKTVVDELSDNAETLHYKGLSITNGLLIRAGNGVDDDSARIQSILNSLQSPTVLQFEAGKKYIINMTVTVNLSKVRGIEGSNALLVTSNNIPILKVFGNKNNASASPDDSVNNTIKDKEMSPYITNLQLRSTALTPFVATGMQIEGTFGLVIEMCHFFNLTKGVELVNYNRNFIFTNNNLWDNVYHMHWNNCNLHQQNIIGNHFTGGKKAIFIEGGSVHNIQISNNDIEGYTGNESLLHFLGDDIMQVNVTGNAIEEHIVSSGAMLLFECTYGKYVTLTVTGNEFSGSNKECIKLVNCWNATITGNSFMSNNSYSVSCYGSCYSILISSNSLYNNTGRKMGGFYFQSNVRLTGIVITNNTAEGMLGKLIVLKGESPTVQARLDRINIANNSLSIQSMIGGTLNPKIPDYAVEIGENCNNVRELFYINNQIRAEAACVEKGVKINPPLQTWSFVIIRNNIVSGLSSFVANSYSLPTAVANRVVVDTNLQSEY